jgi:hypothetical protein
MVTLPEGFAALVGASVATGASVAAEVASGALVAGGFTAGVEVAAGAHAQSRTAIKRVMPISLDIFLPNMFFLLISL